MKWLWTILVLLALRVGAEEITDSASALQRALEDEPLRDQVRNLDHLQSRTRFLEQWNVWMVEFFVEDERIAMLTLNPEGEVLERALNRSDEENVVHRIDELQQELAHAKRIGNEAEVREIQELLERLERSHPFAGKKLDLEQVLATVHGLGGYGMGLICWAPFEGVSGIQVVVEREEDGRWVRIESLPLRQGRWIDHDVRMGETVRYRIGLVAPEQAFSTKRIIEIVPRQLDDSKMPVYTVQIPNEGLERMLADVTEDIEMDFIQRDGDGCRLSLKNVGQEALSLQNLRFVFKYGEKIVRPAWREKGLLTKGRMIKIVFDQDFPTGGLFCVLPIRGAGDREGETPMDFCVIPPMD